MHKDPGEVEANAPLLGSPGCCNAELEDLHGLWFFELQHKDWERSQLRLRSPSAMEPWSRLPDGGWISSGQEEGRVTSPGSR